MADDVPPDLGPFDPAAASNDVPQPSLVDWLELVRVLRGPATVGTGTNLGRAPHALGAAAA